MMKKLFEFFRETFGTHWGSQITSSIAGLVVAAVLLGLSIVFAKGDFIAASGNVLLCLVSALFGWMVGMFFSPFDKKDEERFKYVGKSVTAFVSGYVLSTVQPIITKIVNNAKDSPSAVPWIEVGLATASFLLAALVVFISRSYALRDEVNAKEQDTKKPKTP